VEDSGVAESRGRSTPSIRPSSRDERACEGAAALGRIPLGEASVDDIATALVDRSVLGLPLDEPTRAGWRYLALTAETVRAAFTRRVRPDDLVAVIEGPPPR
jgi:predicted Zn-dependent peptidase